MKTFKRLLETNETWLTEHVLGYARAHGYTEDSSTLEQSWRAAICGFSEPMAVMVDAERWPPEVACVDDAGTDADLLFEFAAGQARLHRRRGVSLENFVGLTKYYRAAYMDMISRFMPPDDEALRCRRFVDRFFDKVEISICRAWQSQTESEALRKFAEVNRDLANEKNRYLTIFESLNEPVILLSDDRRVINLNLAANRLFDDRAVSGQVYYRDGGSAASHPRIMSLLEAAGSATDFEHDLETPAGRRTFRVKIQRILDITERFTGAVVTLSDITDIRKAQRASEAADRAKDVFLATMSHEIRTPINGILGIAQLLRDAPAGGRRDEYVDALLSSGELLLDLVNDVLDYAKLEAGEGASQPVVCPPRDMIERVARLSSGEAARKGLRFDLDVAAECPEFVLADGAKIQRILLNLISNAVKFTQQGAVGVRVEWDGSRLGFIVRDTGPGIPEIDRENVFAPFFQSAASGVDPHSGTGLGLPICARLAELIGADLSLETPAGGGAVLRLSCPVTPAAAPEPRARAGTDVLDALNVLLVEDNAINAMVIEGFLASEGHRVDVVADGGTTMERLRGGAYDIVLMDVHLQGDDGFDIIRRIRDSDDPRLAALPVLVLTADQSDATARRFSRSGADAFQTKPLNRMELRRAMLRVLSGSDDRAPSRGEPSSACPGAVLDPSVIAGHRDAIGRERTGRILAAFLETAARDESALRAAARSDDPRTFASISNGLRSAAQMVGLIRLGRAAEDAERRAGVRPEAADLLDLGERLCAEIDAARIALRDRTE